MPLFQTLSLCSILLLSSCAENKKRNEQNPSQPNIIFILTDDLGYGELDCYGQEKIKTPNIDALAKEGMKFTQFYSGAPVCAPARCILLTGKHSDNAYIRGNNEWASRGEVWDVLPSFCEIAEVPIPQIPASRIKFGTDYEVFIHSVHSNILFVCEQYCVRFRCT